MSHNIRGSDERLTLAERREVLRLIDERLQRGIPRTRSLTAEAIAVVVADRPRKVDGPMERRVTCCRGEMECHTLTNN